MWREATSADSGVVENMKNAQKMKLAEKLTKVSLTTISQVIIDLLKYKYHLLQLYWIWLQHCLPLKLQKGFKHFTHHLHRHA